MATVFLATDLRHEREVALKVLKPELAAVVGGERGHLRSSLHPAWIRQPGAWRRATPR